MTRRRPQRLSRVASGIVLVALAWGCAPHAAHQGGDDPRTIRAEQAEMDPALKRIPHAPSVVQAYEIQDERLTVTVDGTAWKQLGTVGQDTLKRAIWRRWAGAYTRHNGPTGDLIFVLVQDQVLNNLGSYFARTSDR